MIAKSLRSGEIWFCNVTRTIDSVMTKEPLFTVPVGTTLDESREILHRHKVEKLLVVDKDYRLKGKAVATIIGGEVVYNEL
mgnify:CR=1 FL=1